jgi:hypothetical protein
MFVAAFPGGLHFHVKPIPNEVMPLGIWTAPLVYGGGPEARNHQRPEHKQIAQYPNLDSFIHLWANRPPCRLPTTNYRCNCCPRIAMIAADGIDNIFANGIEYVFM